MNSHCKIGKVTYKNVVEFPHKNNVENLYYGDKHADIMFNCFMDLLIDRFDGAPIPTILGVLELVKDRVKEHAG